MPYIRTVTNVLIGSVKQKELSIALSHAGATALSKDVAVFASDVTLSEGLTFGGSAEPCVVVNVESIGGTAADLAEQLTACVVEKVDGVSADRVYLNFSDFPAAEWTKGGVTVASIRAAAAATPSSSS